MVTLVDREDGESRAKGDSMLRELYSDRLRSPRPGCWAVELEQGSLWILYLPDAGPSRREDGEPPEPAFELVRTLEDLGYAGAVAPDVAVRHLRAMSERAHLRLARRAHPDASGRMALAAVATLYLEDLDLPELEATAGELAQSLP